MARLFPNLKPWQVAAGAAGVAALGGMTVLLLTSGQDSKPKRKPNCKNVGTTKGELDGIRYIEHVTGGADPNGRLPMLIVFHSLGANPKGTASFRSLPPTRVIRPYGLHTMGKGYRWWKTQARGDQAELARNMQEASKKLVPFIQDIAICRPTIGKPVVTGSSQGAMVAYMLATLGAPHVAGAVAVLGWLPESLWDRGMAKTVGIHGTRDKTVNYEKTKAYAEAMGFPFYSFDSGHAVSKEMGRKWVTEVKKMLGHAKAVA